MTVADTETSNGEASHRPSKKFPLRGAELVHEGSQFIRFGIVGVLNTIIDFGLFAILYFVGEWHVIVANTTAYAVAVLNSYFLNKVWTFKDESGGTEALLRLGRFVGFNIIGVIIANIVIWVLVQFAPVLLAKMTSIAVTMVWNYWSSRRFVYVERQA